MEADDLTYLTKSYYPYNFIRDEQVVGISPDIIREMWKVMGAEEQPIHIYPWARAYDMVQNVPNTVLFGMARTPERERLFKWVGPITVNRFSLFSRKGKHRTQCFDPAMLRGADIGTVRDDVADQALAALKTGARIQRVSDVEINLRKILDRRIDYMAHEEGCMRLLLKRHCQAQDTLVPVMLLREIPIYVAVSLTVPDELVERMNKALKQVRNAPVYDRIFQKHMQ
ncbi:substrate-binding periplasmic protein [Salidesulfovibrio onnuriiensis]|uniref:substrate-binding periplasmic protein n=1 Tax=Salidesulfovibrio onnuriiensis TaxID=2583823 RepID=UPI00164F55E0|nr:transporter substrate-binding domain-containing protein [Salidesulfovibrio onnuriiensis]